MSDQPRKKLRRTALPRSGSSARGGELSREHGGGAGGEMTHAHRADVDLLAGAPPRPDVRPDATSLPGDTP